MIQPVIQFQSAIFRLGLVPDSRGYVQFCFSKQDPNDVEVFTPLTGEDAFTCEYLPDIFNITLFAMRWIGSNCKEINHDGRHVYFQFCTQEELALQPRRDVQLPKDGALLRMWKALFRPRSNG